MAKPELGAKRTCQSCGAKYYDLMRDPPTCPKCGAVFVATVLTSSAAIARAARADAARKKAEVVDEDEPIEAVEVDEDAEAISLEDADEEAVGAKKKKVAGAAEVDDEDIDVEVDDDDDEDADESFLEPEEGDDDVADIIGDREKDDEA